MEERTRTILPAMLEIMVIFEALLAKGVLTYLDMQEAIARCREDLPSNPIYDKHLDIIEQKYQLGRYRSPG